MRFHGGLGVVMGLLAVAVGVRAQDVTGAGATFPNPIYSRWFSEYHALHPEVRINYQSVGSGAGIRQVTHGVIDFGASDSPMSDRQMRESGVKLVHVPTVLGAVVPAYHLPGQGGELRFAPDVIADIFLGVITRWNDPRLQRDNPGIALPDHTILPVYRSDGSGTTFIFTDFLCKVSAGFAGRVGRGNSVRWPAGVGQKGNEGVAGILRNSPYSFGYLELGYAVQNRMAYGAVRNASGGWVRASVESVTAAAAAESGGMPADLRVSITNARGAGSYPICSFTWLLIPVQAKDPARARVMRDFLVWMLDRGEAEAGEMSYAPLPGGVAERVRAVAASLR